MANEEDRHETMIEVRRALYETLEAGFAAYRAGAVEPARDKFVTAAGALRELLEGLAEAVNDPGRPIR